MFGSTTGLATEFQWATPMISSDYFGVSLRVFHGASSPAEISAKFQREPSHVGIKGTPRGSNRRAPSTATWPEHYWCSDFGEGDTPEERITTVIRFLLAKEKELTSLLQSGGRADIYVFLAPLAALGIELEPALLAILGRLGVKLGLEFIPPPSPQ
jgi:hypothetical protein